MPWTNGLTRLSTLWSFKRPIATCGWNTQWGSPASGVALSRGKSQPPRSKHGWYRRSMRSWMGSHGLSGLRRQCKRKPWCYRRENAGSDLPSPDGAACKACTSMAFSIGCGKIAQAPCSRGEPARLVVNREGNWMLYVLPRMVDPPNGIQLYPDKGPKVRAARAKGKGKQKGRARKARKEGAKAKAEGQARAKVLRTPTPLWIREINEAYLVASCFCELVVVFNGL